MEKEPAKAPAAMTPAAATAAVRRTPAVAPFQFVDRRPELAAQRNMQALASGSAQVRQHKAFQSSVAQRQHPHPLKAPLQFHPYQRDGVHQLMFKAGGRDFDKPGDYRFTAASAKAATTAPPHGGYGKVTGHPSGYGVDVGDVGSYGSIQHLEQTGDGLTGDHQPSGAAIKEAIRLKLHEALKQPLTRGMAQIAYKKAITVVVTDAWHKASSRTYGGRNTKGQIAQDAADLMGAAMEDWMLTVPGLKAEGLTDSDIDDIWVSLCKARDNFFATGEAQYEEFG